MTNAPATEENLPWWKERMVWLVIGLPLSAVVAGLTTVYIAALDPDDMVKAEYSKSGMAVVAPRDAQDAAAALGLSGAVAYRDGEVHLQLDKAPAEAQELQLTLVHPTKAELDQQIPLKAAGRGAYHAQATLTGQGKRHLILEPMDHHWRLEGEWQAPFTEETSLHAGAHNPSTHP